MSFAESSGVITQTGIDNDLSGLDGLTGVTTISRGTGNSQQTVYDIGASRLVIEGTLNHNPDIELLISHNGINDNSFGVITVTGTGTYNFGQSYTGNGITEYSNSLGIVVTKNSNNFYKYGALDVKNGGTFNWNGGIIKTSRMLLLRMVRI